MEQCVGFPSGHACIVLVPDDRETGLCYGCLERRARYEERGLGSEPVRVGIVVDAFTELKARCRCGGLADSPDHIHSLLHAVWVHKLKQSGDLPIAMTRRK